MNPFGEKRGNTEADPSKLKSSVISKCCLMVSSYLTIAFHGNLFLICLATSQLTPQK